MENQAIGLEYDIQVKAMTNQQKIILMEHGMVTLGKNYYK